MGKVRYRLKLAGAAFLYKVFYMPRILKRIKLKDRVNVVFFAFNVDMWKYDGFFRLLLGDERFNPVIVPLLLPEDREEFRIRQQQKMKEYFCAKGYPFFDAYDFSTGKLLDIKSLAPDVVFYAQPYDMGYKAHRIFSLMTDCLFAYIPYCYHMEDDALFYSRALFRFAWKIYYPTEHHRKLAVANTPSCADSIVVCGYPMADRLLAQSAPDYSAWKIQDTSIKRVIWAPHHSILKDDLLDNSRFLELADGMLELARKYEGRLQFAFKPHPRLRSKLYGLEDWGVEKTDAYYRQWEDMPNAIYAEGDYVELFRSSDAMVHDCSSFMGEYLFFDKPVAFDGNRESVSSHLNVFGRSCLACHYQVDSLQEIERFLESVVLGGQDTMAPARRQFRSELADSGNVAERIYSDFKSSLEA